MEVLCCVLEQYSLVQPRKRPDVPEKLFAETDSIFTNKTKTDKKL